MFCMFVDLHYNNKIRISINHDQRFKVYQVIQNNLGRTMVGIRRNVSICMLASITSVFTSWRPTGETIFGQYVFNANLPIPKVGSEMVYWDKNIRVVKSNEMIIVYKHRKVFGIPKNMKKKSALQYISIYVRIKIILTRDRQCVHKLKNYFLSWYLPFK